MTEETEATAPAPLLGLGTWTQQGPATLVVREAGWAVLVPGTRKEVIEAAWSVLGDAPAAEVLLDTLVEEAGLESADELAAILFAVVDGTTATLGVKGRTPLAVYTADGARQVAGTDEEPFVLTSLEGVRRIAFGDLPAEEPVGAPRVSSGVARVRGFVQMVIDPADLDEEARAALAEQVEKDGRSIEDPEAAKRRASKPAPASRPATSASSSSTSSARTPKLADRKPGEMPPSLSRGGSSRAAPAEPASDGPNMFDGLFAEAQPAAPAAASAPTPPAEPTPAPASPAPASAPSTSAPTASTPAPAPDPAAPAPSAEVPTTSTAGVAGSATDPAAAARPAAEPATAPEATRAVAAPASTGTAAAPATSEPPRRRLVSTSLFDRKRPEQQPAGESAAAPAQQAAAPTGAEPASSGRGAEPAEPTAAATEESSPAPEASSAPAAPTPPPSMPTPAPPPSIPTPAPPETDEEVVSSDTQVAPLEEVAEPASEADENSGAPITQIAPIDDGEHEEPEEQVPAPRPRRAAAQTGSSAPELDNTGAYDDLFGKTVFRRIEDAAVRRGEEDEAEDEAPSPSAEEVAPPTAAAPQEATAEVDGAAAPAESAPAASGGDFIDWVPGVGRTAPEIARTAARRAATPQRPEPAYPQVHMAERPPAPQPGPAGASAQVGQQPYGQQAHGQQPHGPYPYGQQPYGQPQHGRSPDGQQPSATPPVEPGTVDDRHANAPHPVAPSGPPAQVAGGTARGGPAAPWASSASGAGQPTTGTVTLSGLVCPSGHANSPERSSCRACGGPLQGTPRTVARPPLGAIELSTGDRLVLDRSAIIGRRPRASRVSVHDVPQLITVPSPQQDISRSHLELRLEGWHVVALDLGTTNGTTLHREGVDPLRLRPREGVVLHEGDVLDLGDGIQLRMRERA